MILSGKPYKPKSKFLWVLGHHLREQREQAGLTQEELSKKAGVARGQLCDTENGKVDVRIETIRRLTTAIGINTGDFLKSVVEDFDLG